MDPCLFRRGLNSLFHEAETALGARRFVGAVDVAVAEHAVLVTPVLGGVRSMTIAMLMASTMEAAKWAASP